MAYTITIHFLPLSPCFYKQYWSHAFALRWANGAFFFSIAVWVYWIFFRFWVKDEWIATFRQVALCICVFVYVFQQRADFFSCFCAQQSHLVICVDALHHGRKGKKVLQWRWVIPYPSLAAANARITSVFTWLVLPSLWSAQIRPIDFFFRCIAACWLMKMRSTRYEKIMVLQRKMITATSKKMVNNSALLLLRHLFFLSFLFDAAP